jgi:hypothetical protein
VATAHFLNSSCAWITGAVFEAGSSPSQTLTSHRFLKCCDARCGCDWEARFGQAVRPRQPSDQPAHHVGKSRRMKRTRDAPDTCGIAGTRCCHGLPPGQQPSRRAPHMLPSSVVRIVSWVCRDRCQHSCQPSSLYVCM